MRLRGVKQCNIWDSWYFAVSFFLANKARVFWMRFRRAREAQKGVFQFGDPN